MAKKLFLSLLFIPVLAFAQNPGQSINIKNWNGLTPKFYTSHITTSGTFTPAASTVYVSSVAVICSNAGTGWTLKIQDKDTTPAFLVPSFTLTVPTNGSPNVAQSFPIPLIMPGGFDVITAGTAGVVDVKVSYWTPFGAAALPTPTATATATSTPTPTP